MIPENTIEKVPTFIIPGIYTAIVMFLVERKQGTALKLQKEIEDGFYSGWRAAGVGLLGAFVFVGSAVAFFLLQPDDFNNDLKFIRQSGIPAWKRNQSLLNGFQNDNVLSGDILNRVNLLKKYCELRVESYTLIGKTLSEDTNQYDSQLEAVNIEIETVLNLLN